MVSPLRFFGYHSMFRTRTHGLYRFLLGWGSGSDSRSKRNMEHLPVFLSRFSRGPFVTLFCAHARQFTRCMNPIGYTRKNAQVVTNLQASCNKSAIKPLQHVFPLLVPSCCNTLLTSWIADLLQVCPNKSVVV